MFDLIKRKDFTSLWLIYYIVLGVIQAMWTNPSAFPPMPLRLAMNVAVFLPMLLRRECAIFGIPFFMILTELLLLFGGYSVYSVENFVMVRASQGKAILAGIILPFLFYQ